MYDEMFEGYMPPKELILRPLQVEIVNMLRESFGKANRVVLMAGTGLGKTIIATHIIKSASNRGKRCLFINDRITLVNQTSGVFTEYGVKHGVIMADHYMNFPDRPVQVASIQTIARRDIGNFDLIVWDEAHTIFKAHKKVLKDNPDALVIGLSATPFSKGLGKYFDFHIEPYTVRQLINHGLLCDFEVYGPEIYDLSAVKTVAGEYNQKELAAVTDQTHLVADVVSTYLKLGKGRKTICFCTNVAHGRHLVKSFGRSGIKAVDVNAYQSPEESKENMRMFIEGEVDVICSVEILIKGFDLSSVDCVVWATATKSIIKWIQGCGRGLRTHDGKTLCRIIDHGGNCERLGFPDSYEFLQLDDGKHQESKNKNQDKPEQLPKKCPSCDYLKAAGVRKCPACGFIPQFTQDVEVVEGELKKIQRKERKEFTLQDKKEFLGGLNQYAEDKGWKQGKKGVYGASIHKFKEKFGCIPSNQIPWDYKCPINDDVKKFIQHSNIRFAKSKEKKTAKVDSNSLHGKMINLDTLCECGSVKGMLYPKGPHLGVECVMCSKWQKWISIEDASGKAF